MSIHSLLRKPKRLWTPVSHLIFHLPPPPPKPVVPEDALKFFMKMAKAKQTGAASSKPPTNYEHINKKQAKSKPGPIIKDATVSVRVCAPGHPHFMGNSILVLICYGDIFCSFHWILLVIHPNLSKIIVLDSKKRDQTTYQHLIDMLNRLIRSFNLLDDCI